MGNALAHDGCSQRKPSLTRPDGTDYSFEPAASRTYIQTYETLQFGGTDANVNYRKRWSDAVRANRAAMQASTASGAAATCELRPSSQVLKEDIQHTQLLLRLKLARQQRETEQSDGPTRSRLLSSLGAEVKGAATAEETVRARLVAEARSRAWLETRAKAQAASEAREAELIASVTEASEAVVQAEAAYSRARAQVQAQAKQMPRAGDAVLAAATALAKATRPVTTAVGEEVSVSTMGSPRDVATELGQRWKEQPAMVM